ncbi:MAG: hypothetical protein QOF01_3729 [Thermomicrobiales bacterium]|jgi:hypothetical protein|nr:hypothetical protein [Thermomicrobiales bacterium]MEA2597260.1 hypothetical protein [Thermomicrobiales bacterium]
MPRHPVVRTFALAALVVVAAVALVLGSAPLRTGAQDGTPTAADRGFVGAWHLTTQTPFGPSQSLITFMADGTVLFTDRPVYPGDAGFPVTFISAGHGVWEQTGPDTAAATWVEFVTDGEGNFLAVVTDSVEMTLGADGNSWSGPFSSTSADPSGNVLFVGGGTVEATRITVQPLATPAAGTPAA